MDTPAQRAIDAALKGNWKAAELLNEEILKSEPNDKEALNRLARASIELGKTRKALINYNKVLLLDPYNQIARKALGRLKASRNGNSRNKKFEDLKGRTSSFASADLFIEEPGKTKNASLIHLGDTSVISSLDAGDKVSLAPHAHRVSVETETGDYIGRLPDDLSRRIIKLVNGGNQYGAFIRSVDPKNVRIFIRETQRSEKLKDTPSFPVTEKANYVSFTPPELVHGEKPDVAPLDQDQ